MALLSADGVGKSFGAHTCFEGASFFLKEGARVGLIGANGAGKTTLFKILLGETDYDGSVSRQKGLRIGVLDQDPKLPGEMTVHEAVVAATPVAALEKGIAEIHKALGEPGADTEKLLARLSDLETKFERADGYAVESKAERILVGLDLPTERHGDPVSALSGGEKTRVALARLLLVESDILLLDEPTNHLDLAGIAFLEEFLRESRAAILVISHDRHFLDAVTTETWEIEGGKLWTYPAPYTGARALRQERLKAAWRAFDIQRSYIEKQEEYVRRFGAGQRARQARGRNTRLARLERLDQPEDQARVMGLNLPSGEPVGARPPLRVRDLAMGYAGRTLFKDLSFDVEPGETLGIVGPNGAGKTTLLKLLTGELEPRPGGEVIWSGKAQKGILTQHETFPDGGTTPFGYLRGVEPQRSDQALRNTLGAMLFTGDEANKPVSALSGGERKRLALTRLLLQGNNVLMLDEPTNHLDLPSREAVECALSVFEGTLVVVSHDRYFLDRLADRVLWLEDGRWHVTKGGYEEARAARQARALADQPAKKGGGGKPQPSPQAKPQSQPSRAPAASGPYAKLKPEELEVRIAACEAKLKELQFQFADEQVYRDPKKVQQLKAALAKAQQDLAALEAAYAERLG